MCPVHVRTAKGRQVNPNSQSLSHQQILLTKTNKSRKVVCIVSKHTNSQYNVQEMLQPKQLQLCHASSIAAFAATEQHISVSLEVQQHPKPL